jgi:alpha-maltose-1-phosphate synthase
MSFAISYTAPNSGAPGEIFGLDVAVQTFLSAWLRHTTQDRLFCRVRDSASFPSFVAMASSVGRQAADCVMLDARFPDQLAGVKTVFQPDPNNLDLLWQRPQVAGPGYASCGLIHTMSGERIVHVVGNHLTAPSETGDALICPSRAIRDAVRRLWEITEDYYQHRLGGDFRCPVDLPIIPLGVDTARFAAKTTPDLRAAQRQALGLADDDIALLFVGRQSFVTKAHPLPMFQAAERASEALGAPLHLICQGYFKPQDMERHFKFLAADICKTAKVHFIAHDDPRFPMGLWAGADIFMSLSDNIQESFGLTPIEAMAAGLPAIVTDWDGYRDTVRHGVEGFCVPTLTPPAASGQLIAERYFNARANYGEYLAAASQSTAVDVDFAAAAVQLLATDPALRQKMGQAGRARAAAVYDWSHIIRAYEDLWAQQADQRRQNTGGTKSAFPPGWPALHPAYPNPFEMFASFPSTLLAPTARLAIAALPEEMDRLLAHEMNRFMPDLLLPLPDVPLLWATIGEGKTVAELHSLFAVHDPHCLDRTLVWLLKLGLCRRIG